MNQDNQDSLSVENWTQETASEVSIEELDRLTQEYVEARADYDEKKTISNAASNEMKEKMRKLCNALERAGKKSWDTELGKVTSVAKFQFTTPKSVDDKQRFAKYLQDRYGKDMFWSLFSVNSMSLNSFLKEELKNNPEEQFPGIDDPTAIESIQFRRKK